MPARHIRRGTILAASVAVLLLQALPALAVPFSLTVAKDGTGTGRVTSSPAGIDCGSDCSEDYEDGTTVTLSATPDAGSYFVGWTGAGCSGTGSCTMTVSENTTVTATFNAKTPKQVKLKASDRQIDEGDRVRLTVKLQPCAGNEFDQVSLRGGGKTRTRGTNASCKAKFRLRLKMTTRFRASSPEDENSLGDVSKRVKIRVIPKPEPKPSGGGGGGGGGGNCHSSYPDFCIPPPPPDLDCADVNGSNFTVVGSDPHGFDGDGDGRGCES